VRRTQHEVRAEDGRLLLVEVAGPDQGDAIFFHHGTPGSRFRDDEMIEVGAERGLRHVSYSRPGYEGSDRQAGRGIVNCAGDARAIVEQLGLDDGYVVGESGGGPYALAQAASLPGWVRAVAVIVGPAPYGAEELDWFEGMAKANRVEFDALMAGDAAWLAFLETRLGKIRAAGDLRQLYGTLDDLFTDADLQSLEREGLEDEVMLAWRRIATSGFWGWFDDGKAALESWGFELGQVEAPVAVWHGEDDRAVPVGHGRWVADHLPNATFHPLPGEGHSSSLDHYGSTLDDLIASSGT
jgi:pimeloyl-ACP methyl ester carboxylesterase